MYMALKVNDMQDTYRLINYLIFFILFLWLCNKLFYFQLWLICGITVMLDIFKILMLVLNSLVWKRKPKNIREKYSVEIKTH